MPNKLNCKGWCPPTVIYLTLSLVSIAISLVTSHYHDDKYYRGENKVVYTISHLLGLAIWTSFLYWLCSNCYNTTAWFVLLLPIFIVFFFVLAIMFSVDIAANQQNVQVRRVYY